MYAKFYLWNIGKKKVSFTVQKWCIQFKNTFRINFLLGIYSKFNYSCFKKKSRVFIIHALLTIQFPHSTYRSNFNFFNCCQFFAILAYAPVCIGHFSNNPFTIFMHKTSKTIIQTDNHKIYPYLPFTSHCKHKTEATLNCH